MGKVVHIPDDVHHRAKSYCAERKMRMSDWISDLVRSALNPPKIQLAEPTTKKTITSVTEDTTNAGPKPWEQPPFWANKKDVVEGQSSHPIQKG